MLFSLSYKTENDTSFQLERIRITEMRITEIRITEKLLSNTSNTNFHILGGGGGGVQQQKRSCRREKPKMSFVFLFFFVIFQNTLKIDVFVPILVKKNKKDHDFRIF